MMYCIDSLEGQRVLIQCVALIITIVWVTHMFSCAFFAVGTMAPSDTGGCLHLRAVFKKPTSLPFTVVQCVEQCCNSCSSHREDSCEGVRTKSHVWGIKATKGAS
eukprot:5780547-Amphidinium_carterae.1